MIQVTEDLIAAVKRKTLAPIAQITFQNQDIVNILNEEMENRLVPDVQKVRENFFLTSKQVPIEAGNRLVGIPSRAIAGAFKDVFVIDTGGNRYPLNQGKLSELHYGSTSGNGAPGTYIVQGDQIRLDVAPATAGYFVEFWYYNRPSKLVLSTECSTIVSVTDNGDGTSTISTDIDLSTSLTISDKIDVLTQSYPIKLYLESIQIIAIAGQGITVATSALTSAPAVGDLVALEGFTNSPMLPPEMHPVLTQMGAAAIVESMGDVQKLQIVNAKLAEIREGAMSLIANRVENDPQTISRARNGLNRWGCR